MSIQYHHNVTTRAGLEEEILTNTFFQVYLENNLPLTSQLRFLTSEFLEGGHILLATKIFFNLAEFYANNHPYFSSIGDPELPMKIAHFSIEDYCYGVGSTLAFEFDNQTSMCLLKIPNILGFNEPHSCIEDMDFDTLVSVNHIPKDVSREFRLLDEFSITNTFLFSEDIDFAIDKGYSDLILDRLKNIISLTVKDYIFRVEIIDETSPLHLKNYSNRVNEDISKVDKSFLSKMSYKYNIIFSTVNTDYYGSSYHDYDDEEFIGLDCYLQLSKVLKKIRGNP